MSRTDKAQFDEEVVVESRQHIRSGQIYEMSIELDGLEERCTELHDNLKTRQNVCDR